MATGQVVHPALKSYQSGSGGSPTVWCEGCGIGQVWQWTVRAIEELHLDPNSVVWVGGSGCTGRMCTYWAYDYMHTLHGRPLGFATGVKLANPALKVICHMGDGETSAIGGNHLIQTARRNVDLVAICVNNFNYGMTGGQFSPTTPERGITKTSPHGQQEAPFDLCELVKAAGATYVARWTTSHPRQSINAIKKAIEHKGFSFVEIIAQCPTHYGRNNRIGDAVAMMRWQKEMTITRDRAQGLGPEESHGKWVIGEFQDVARAEYGDVLRGVRENGDE